ncbi:MAG: hypothetical protein VX667_01805, partial [Nitrospinota bacterium]|nr:hypothetical protein [Nitrospinota bacterium]
DSFNVRGGVVLVPVGFLNEFHEPPLFWSVERPEFHSKIIPSTWVAAGLGFFGTPMEGMNYRLYLTNSLESISDGTDTGSGNGSGGFSGAFTAQTGIRGGRHQINGTAADDLAVSGRVEYSRFFPGLNVGASFYTGETTQGFISEGGRTTVLEADMKYREGWFDMNASIANIIIEDGVALNNFCSDSAHTCSAEIADNIFGFNAQAGVHLFQLMGKNTSHDLVAFFLYEKIRPQDSMPHGTAPTHSSNFDLYTVGMSYMPIESVAIKADYQQFILKNNTTENKINIGLAYMY